MPTTVTSWPPRRWTPSRPIRSGSTCRSRTSGPAAWSLPLPAIERRLEETSATVGSPDEIRRFVLSGLNRFGCGVEENSDGSLLIAIAEPALQTASTGALIPRATFDPEWALDDPDVTLIDVGHPLVRRLVEEVKHRAFRDTAHYGRTAYLVTPDVEEVTALFHLLVRYAVNTQPVSIIEELLPVAVPVYGDPPSAFSGQRAAELARAGASSETRSDAKVREGLEDALSFDGLALLFSKVVEARRQELASERASMRRQMEERETGTAGSWLQGIDALSPGSVDVLTVAVCFPALTDEGVSDSWRA